ncbi:MAG: UPF0149 family protein [Halieaceae bacterium]|jgi:uncharacterized protein|nr:UPF0149 family protein [Halieaceae bacterium]
MNDDQWGGQHPFCFDELANHLLEQGLQSSPSEIHGCITGLLASGAAVEGELALAALADALDLVVHGELAEEIMRLYAVTDTALLADDFHFYPLLPDDDMALYDRSVALAGWCQCFLVGFAQGTAGSNESNMTGDSSEVLKDILAFAELEEEQAEDEDAEAGYAEIVEYLRVAVLNVYMDNQSDKSTADGRGALH